MRITSASILFTAALSLTACSKKAETKADDKVAAKPTETAVAPKPAPAPTGEDVAMDQAAQDRLAADTKCKSGDRHDCDGDGVRFEDDKDDNNPSVGAAGATPFSLTTGGKAKAYAEGCLTNLTPGWVVMAPNFATKKVCDVSGEDDYAFSLHVQICKGDAKCALPKPGDKLEAKLEVGSQETKTTVTVVRHEKPYIVLAIAPDAKGNNGGELRVLVDANPLVDAASWL
jgi:hypothetical protein